MNPDTLLSLVQEKLDGHLDHVAALFDDGNQERQLTYAQLWNLSSKVSTALGATGSRDQVIGLCLQTDERMPAILLGVLQCGASFYNLTSEAGVFTCKVLTELRIQVLIVHQQYLQAVLEETIRKLGGPVRQTNIDGVGDYILVVLCGSKQKYLHGNLAYCITTSGTTGIPKVVRVPNSCIVPNVIHLRDIYSLTSRDCVFLASPLTFDPSIVEVFTCLSVGACLLIVPPSLKMLPDKLLDMLYHRHPVSVMQVTPTLLLRFNKAKMPLTLLGDKSVLRVLALGGEKFPACSVIRKLRSLGNKTTFYNLYGTTEVSSWAMWYKVTEEDLRGDKDIPLGDPLMGTTIQVQDPTGADVKEGTGMLYIGGTERQCIIGPDEADIYSMDKLVVRATGDVVRREPMVVRATGDVVRREPMVVRATGDVVRREPMVVRATGDVVRREPGGAALYYIGREDYQIKRNGKRLDLEEISEVVCRHSAVQSCVAVYIPPSVVLYVVLHPLRSSVHDQPRSTNHGAEGRSGSSEVPVTMESIQRFLKDSLPAHCLPDDIVDVSEVPMTTHGKLDRDHLERVYRARSGCSPSVTMATHLLVQQWKMLCTSRSIPEDSNFITDGGNSLNAVHLLTILHDSVNREMPELLDILMNKTFRDVKAYLEYVFEDKASINDGSECSVDTFKTNSHDEVTPKPSVEHPEREIDGGYTQRQTLDNCYMMKLKPEETENGYSLKRLKDNSANESCIMPIFGNNGKGMDDKDSEQLQLSVRKKQKVESLYIDVGDRGNIKDEVLGIGDRGNIKDEVLGIGDRGDIKDAVLGIGDTGDAKDAVKEYHFIKSVGRGSRVIDICKQELKRLTGEMDDQPETGEMRDKPETGEVRDKPETGEEGDGSDMCTGVTDGGMGDEVDIHLKEVWKHNTGKCVDASPVLAVSSGKNGVVYIGSHSHKFAAITLSTGECLWEVTLPDRVESSACLSITGRFIVVGCYDGYVYVLHSGTGDIWWSFCTGSEVKSSPAVDMVTGHVYIGSHSQSVYCLDVQRRTVVWEKCLNSGSIFASPAVGYDPHTVIVATLRGKLFALETDLGHTLWTFDCRMPLFSSPVVTQCGVYIGCTDHALYHLSFHGTLVWKYKTNGPIFSSSAFGNTRDAFSSTSTSASAFGNTRNAFSSTRASASEKYANEVGGITHHQVAREVASERHNEEITEYPSSGLTKQPSNQSVVFGSHDSCVYCLSLAGDRIWKVKVESPVYSTPFLFKLPVTMVMQDHCKVGTVHVSSDDDIPAADAQKLFKLKVDRENVKCNMVSLVVFASTAGTLYIVNSVTGGVVCKHKLRGEVFSSPIVYRKCVIVGCRDDFVYCYQMLPLTLTVRDLS